MLAGAILEHAFGEMNDKAEAIRRRRNARFTGVRVLVMPVVGLPLNFAFAVSMAPFLAS